METPFVIDAVTHAFDAQLSYRGQKPEYEYGWVILESTRRFHDMVMPNAYQLSEDEWYRETTAEVLASVLFRESTTDFAFYHPIPGSFWPDLSPARVGRQLAERFPGRVQVYGAVSPLNPKALDDLEREAQDWPLEAIKLYPVDFIDGELKPWTMDDVTRVYPILERCGELGIRTVAVHKAVPVASAPTQPFRPEDVEEPAKLFPEINFEIVHGGFNFLEETAFQTGRFPNIFINLENTSALIVRQPKRFARILGELILWGGHDKILWGTGATAFHPRPLLEAFLEFDFAEEDKATLGYPTLTNEMKADILGRNGARVHGLDIDQLRTQQAGDEISAWRDQSHGLAQPWTQLRFASDER